MTQHSSGATLHRQQRGEATGAGKQQQQQQRVVVVLAANHSSSLSSKAAVTMMTTCRPACSATLMSCRVVEQHVTKHVEARGRVP
jgi:hypothetical protein